MRPGRSKELEVATVAIGKGICLILLTPGRWNWDER